MLSAPRTRVAATPSVSSHRALQRPRPLAWSRPLGTLAGKEEGAAAPGPALPPRRALLLPSRPPRLSGSQQSATHLIEHSGRRVTSEIGGPGEDVAGRGGDEQEAPRGRRALCEFAGRLSPRASGAPFGLSGRDRLPCPAARAFAGVPPPRGAAVAAALPLSSLSSLGRPARHLRLPSRAPLVRGSRPVRPRPGRLQTFQPRHPGLRSLCCHPLAWAARAALTWHAQSGASIFRFCGPPFPWARTPTRHLLASLSPAAEWACPAAGR